MSSDAYELIALTARYFFAGMMLLIVLRAGYLTMVDSRRSARLRRLSPMTGLTGELIVLEGDERARRGMRYPVIREGMIGASRSADVRVRHSSVRRRHAYFQLTKQGLALRSHAGARLYDRDDRAVREVVLCDGDEVRIGRVRFLLILSEATAEQAGTRMRGDGLFSVGDRLSAERRAALRARHGDDLFGETSMDDFDSGFDEFDRAAAIFDDFDHTERDPGTYSVRDDLQHRGGSGDGRSPRMYTARDDAAAGVRTHAVRDDGLRRDPQRPAQDVFADGIASGARMHSVRNDAGDGLFSVPGEPGDGMRTPQRRAGTSAMSGSEASERRAAARARMERREDFRRTMGLGDETEPSVSRSSAGRRGSGTGASRSSGTDVPFSDRNRPSSRVHSLDAAAAGRVAFRENSRPDDPFDGIVRVEGEPARPRRASAEDGIAGASRRRPAHRDEDDLFMTDRD